jgi:putative membrane protein
MDLTQFNWVSLLAHWLVSAFALKVTAAIMPGFRVKTFSAAMIASLVIGLANIYVRPFLVFLTFPFTVLTLGLFLFVVDAIILRICSSLLDDFEIGGWLAAIFGGILLSTLSTVLHWLVI